MTQTHLHPAITFAQIGDEEYPILHKTNTHIVICVDHTLVDDIRNLPALSITPYSNDGDMLFQVPVGSVTRFLDDLQAEAIELMRNADEDLLRYAR